jgi:hypothetical protein
MEELLKKKNELEKKTKELAATEKEMKDLEQEIKKKIYWLPCLIKDQPIEYWERWFYEGDLPSAINEAKHFIKELEDYIELGKYLIEKAERLDPR